MAWRMEYYSREDRKDIESMRAGVTRMKTSRLFAAAHRAAKRALALGALHGAHGGDVAAWLGSATLFRAAAKRQRRGQHGGGLGCTQRLQHHHRLAARQSLKHCRERRANMPAVAGEILYLSILFCCFAFLHASRHLFARRRLRNQYARFRRCKAASRIAQDGRTTDL
jgi:hypothetical protein